MSKLRSHLSLVLLLLLAVVVCVYTLRGIWQGDTRRSLGPASPPEARIEPRPQPSAQEAVTAAPVESARESPSTNLANRFRDGRDYLAFARSLQDAAKAGDADAQYYLFRTLEYCHGQYRVYFGRPGTGRSFDEGLRWAAAHSGFLDVEEARLVHERCHEMESSHSGSFGEREQWLQNAANGGEPRAQVAFASRLFRNSQELPATEGERSRHDARDLVSQALESKSPEVIMAVGDLLALREGVVGDETDVAAWYLAACLRGLDCSPQGERMKLLCRFDSNCQPYESFADMARRMVPDYQAVEAKAKEINRLIDAGSWAELGFGPSKSGP